MSIVTVDKISGRGVPLHGNDIDTDRIIPARFLKCVTFDGLGDHAFEDDILDAGRKGHVHPFRDPRFAGAQILVSNSNFGCGSSREHAPQALKRWGVAAIIAESYSEIFFGNCVALGIPCFSVDHATAEQILSWIEANPSLEMTASVSARSLSMGDNSIPLGLADGPRGQFLDGSWNARAALLSNAQLVQDVAQQLPYVNGFVS